jgi:phosphopantetheinyl transferase
MLEMIEIAYFSAAEAGADAFIAEFASPADHAVAGGARPRLAVRALLRAMLARCYGRPAGTWQIASDAKGAPEVSAKGVARSPFISLSHSATLVAVAISTEGPVGVDIERLRPGRDFAALARAAFGTAEQAAVKHRGIEAFYRIWTLREALAKARREGWELLVNRIDVVPSDPGPHGQLHTVDGVEWRFSFWLLPDEYGLGVVQPGHVEDTEIHPVSWLADYSPSTGWRLLTA